MRLQAGHGPRLPGLRNHARRSTSCCTAASEAFGFNPMLFADVRRRLSHTPSLCAGETPRFLYARWFGWGSFVV